MDGPTLDIYEAHAAEWAERRPPRLLDEAAAFSQRCLSSGPILDVGCGPGSYFGSLGRPLVGLDGARAMLELARHPGPQQPGDRSHQLAGWASTTQAPALVQADLARLPFAPRSLGGAWARASYLHLPKSALPLALAHLHHALALGAPIELTVKVGEGEGLLPDDDFPGRFFALWNADDLARVIEGAGFILDPEGVRTAGEWVTVRARAWCTLPDFVGPGMRVLVCGLNPSIAAADAGFGYAGPTNRFWRAAIAAGLIDPARARQPLVVLARDQVGMTDLVKRATPTADVLATSEYRSGWERLCWLARWLRPSLVLFVGLAGWRAAVNRHAQPGPQLEIDALGCVPAYVMPSTSGLNAATRFDDLVKHIRRAGALVAGSAERADATAG